LHLFPENGILKTHPSINLPNQGKKMKEIKRSEIIQVLTSIRGGQIGSIIVRGEVKMNKRGNPYLQDLVESQKRVSILFNFDYGKAVNNRREKMGLERDFVPAPRKWGKPIENGHIISHNGNLYLSAQRMGSSETRYFLNGEEIDKEVIADFLPARRAENLQNLSSDKLEGMEQEEVEKWACENVQYRDFKINSIREIRAGGEVYKVVG
jgi:hypothetical protein